jgi:hypothetical protein
MLRAEWSPSVLRMSRRSALGVFAGLVLAACAPRRPLAPSIDGMAETYVRTALQLAQHQPRLVDGWLGPDHWRPGPRVPVAGLVTTLEALLRGLEPIAASDPEHSPRARYLLAQTRALFMAGRRLLGDTMSLALEAQVVFGRSMPPADLELVASAREALELRLPGTGPLGARLQAFRRQEIVPQERVDAVFARALAVCRDVTRAAIPLPPDEHVDVVKKPQLAWDGFCRYRGGRQSVIEINRDAGFPVSRLLRLAAHEGYPGHHVQHVLTDTVLVSGRGRMEFALQPAFGPHLLLAEGAAEVGVDLVLPDTHRMRLYEEDLLPAAGLAPGLAETMVAVERLALDIESLIPEIVAAYLDGTASGEATVERLTEETLVADPRAFLPFAERQRTGLYVYPVGRHIVADAIFADGAPGAWGRLRDLYETWALA